jgi:predicted AlkP superfamily pyrophosphatase or phosphodiesterase
MNHPRRLLLLLSVALVLALGNRPAPAEPHKDRCVIMVTIDGLANFYIDDPKSDVPVMRMLAARGARAEGGVIAAFPTVTWPTHTTLATGTWPARHGVVGNSYFDRATAKSVPLILDRVLNKDQTVQVPTIYDAAHQAGLKTAAVCWPASREAKSLDWTVPDMFDADAWPKYGTQSWLNELRQAGWPVDKQNEWCSTPGGGVSRDWLYTRMVRHALQEHAPNLILLHLVEPDHVEHAHGPRSAEAYWIASYSDDRIRDLVEAIAASPLAGKTTLFVLSDHGFFPVNHEIRPNVVLRKLGLIQGSGKTETRTAYCMAEGGACAVYIMDRDRRDQIARQLRAELGKQEGVQRVFDVGEFAAIGQPTPTENPRGADLWLAAKRDYAFSEASGGELVTVKQPKLTGTHGYLPDQPDMLSLCIVSGPAVKAGTKLGKIRAIDIAPTVASILGVELPAAEGRPLQRLLGR